MNSQMLTRHKAIIRGKHAGLIIITILLLALTVLLIMRYIQPKRSIASYCEVYKQQTAKLGHPGGDTYTYSSSVFPDTSSDNPGDFIPAFNKLDAVAPNEIEPQVRAMRNTFVQMRNKPTQALSAALNGMPAQDAVTQWTKQHCNS